MIHRRKAGRAAAAVLAASAHKDEAQAFLDYLKADESVAVFEAVGFAMAK